GVVLRDAVGLVVGHGGLDVLVAGVDQRLEARGDAVEVVLRGLRRVELEVAAVDVVSRHVRSPLRPWVNRNGRLRRRWSPRWSGSPRPSAGRPRRTSGPSRRYP